MNGTVYLLHLDSNLAHARHYIGWAKDLDARMRDHGTTNGSRLLAAAARSGIGWRVVRTWPGDRHLERKLKRRKDAASLCPECCERRRAYRALWKRIRRTQGPLKRTVRC